MGHFHRHISFFGLLLLSFCAKADPGVLFRILDRRTYQPIAFASVVVRNFGGLSQVMEADRSGICETTLVNGKFQVIIKAKGYLPLDTTIRIHKDLAELSFFLTKVYTQDSLVEMKVSNETRTVQLEVREETPDPIEEKEEIIAPPAEETKANVPPVVVEAKEQAEQALTPQTNSAPERKGRPVNLVFLVDCSSSMRLENKMGLAKATLLSLVKGLTDDDRIALVAYGSDARVVMETQPGNAVKQMEKALAELEAKGTTKTGSGLDEAYRLAQFFFMENGLNEVLLVTDGAIYDNGGSLVRRVNEARAMGINLSIVGIKNQAWTEAGLQSLSGTGGGQYLRIGTDADADRLKEDIKKRSF